MFKIGDFSKLCRVPVSALRYYADIGLLEPIRIDHFTSYSYYSLDQLPRLNRILALKDLGLALEQIKQIMNEELPASEIRGMLRLKEAELQAELDEREARLARVKARLNLIEQENVPLPENEVVLKSLDPQMILTLRETAPIPAYVATLLGEACMTAISQGVQLIGAPFMIFHDEEFKSVDLDIEVALPIAQAVQVDLEHGRKLQTLTLEAVSTAACMIHVGDYDNFTQTYSLLGRWIEANAYRIAGPAREIYLRAPGEEGALTEIQFPIERE